MNAIEVSGLAKKYGRVEALRSVDLSVREGEVFGLVGPNGAGKTTLIKGLVGALRPSGGGVRVMGLNPLGDRTELRRRMFTITKDIRSVQFTSQFRLCQFAVSIKQKPDAKS